MYDNDRILKRDVEATLVPYGDRITIAEGTEVTITHRLGGNFTVTWSSGMAQINGRKYADALGEELPEEEVPASTGDHQGPPEKEVLWDALKKVYDPEIPVDIVNLGLVYTLEVVPEGDPAEAYDVKCEMTLTAPGCGMGPAIAQDAKYNLEKVPGVREATVDIVWDPPWNQNMITEEGKMELGLI
jgi:probable FeS assembly SUF system protein SufT